MLDSQTNFGQAMSCGDLWFSGVALHGFISCRVKMLLRFLLQKQFCQEIKQLSGFM